MDGIGGPIRHLLQRFRTGPAVSTKIGVRDANDHATHDPYLMLEATEHVPGQAEAAKAIADKSVELPSSIVGPDAKAAATAIGLGGFSANATNGTSSRRPPRPRPDGVDTTVQPLVVGTTVAITFAVVFAVIAIAALAVVGAACLAGMTKGYTVDAKAVQGTGGNIEEFFPSR